MKRTVWFALALLFTLLLQIPLSSSFDTTAYITDLRVKKLEYWESESVSVAVKGYKAGYEGDNVEISVVVIEGDGGGSWEAYRRDIKNTGYNDITLGKLKLGNSSFNTFTLLISYDFADGYHWQDAKNIVVRKKPDSYSADFSSDGSRLFFFSHKNFTVEFIYTYGPNQQNSTIFHNVHGRHTFRIPEYKGLTSVDVYVTDRWGNVNSGERVTEWGDRAPIHYFYYERPDFWENVSYISLAIITFCLTGILVFLLLRNKRPVLNFSIYEKWRELR